MKFSELKKVLRQHGCYIAKEGANHEIWYSPISNKTFPVSRHNSEDVKKGTLNSILNQARIVM
ncbi:MAG: type II toxin-antitoxin system HicA family toxin [Clostridia bacterium]|nr:type II toxin-antitoxin system HicA family toxin [Clostridia bacterium]